MTDRGTWRQVTNLVATDLEGTGESGDAAVMLEFAAVPLVNGVPALASAFSTLINPQRPVARRPWMSPGITSRALELAPTLEQVAPKITPRLTGAYLIGHNIGVDWRLLHRRCPAITVAGLVDTYQLAKALPATGKRSLTALLDAHQLTEKVNAAAPTSQPHRALWDTIAAALLLDALIRKRWTTDPTLDDLLTATDPSPAAHRRQAAADPPSLFDPPDPPHT